MSEITTASLKKVVEWLFNPKLRWVYHLLFWTFTYIDELLSLIGFTETMDQPYLIPLSLFVDMVLVYAGIYILLPLYLMMGKIRYFFVFTLIMVLLHASIQLLLWFPLEDFQGDMPYLISILLTMLVSSSQLVGLVLGIKIFKSYILNMVRLKELETDALKTELVYLKNQINPHFLFNSLNNIYILNRRNPEVASESILLLSDLLRYQLYECNKEKVNLNNEIDYLNNFLDLDKLRKDNMEFSLDVEGNTTGLTIAPYIFLPFVENAIKHSSSTDNEKGYLSIQLKIAASNQLLFSVKNSKPALPLITETGGIGLVNAKRRLELVYPNQYQLDISNEKDYYEVKLSLNL